MVLSQPKITNFTPTSGPVGSSVMITGSGFCSTAASNIVFFGATRANVTAANATQLEVTVPIGSIYKPISVTNGITGLTAFSQRSFITTFTCGGIIDLKSFEPKVAIPNTSGYAIGDLDGDGKLDLVDPGSPYGSISGSIYRNVSATGSFSFTQAATGFDFPLYRDGGELLLSDMDGDGKLDIVVGKSLYRNLSTIGFISFASPQLVSPNPTMAIADIDADGKTDLVSWDSSGKVFVMKNKSTVGRFSFGVAESFQLVYTNVITYISGFAVGNLDGDNKPDIIIGLGSNYYSDHNSISVFKNVTVSNVVAFAPEEKYQVNERPFLISIYDLDGDGNNEIIHQNMNLSYRSTTISIYKNSGVLGNRSFVLSFANTNYNPQNLSISDLDGDGKPDLAVSSYNGPIEVHKNISSGSTIAFAKEVEFSSEFSSRILQIGDFDCDGKPDLPVLGNNGFSIFRNSIFKSPTVDGTISASATSICLGQSVTISSRDGAGEPYYWASTNGGSSWDVFQGAYAGQSSFPYTPTQAGTYRFHLRNRTSCGFCWDSGNNGCPTFPYVDVVVNPRPIDGNIRASATSICLGQSVTISSDGTGTPYYWAWVDGAPEFEWQSFGQSFTYTPTQAGNYRFHVRNRTDCGFCWDSGNNQCPTFPYIDVVVNPRPIDGNIIASATSISLGQSVTISRSGGVGSPYYSYTTNGGASWVSLPSQSGQASFNFTPTQSGTYRFTYRNQTACGFCWDSGNNGCPTFPYIDVVVNSLPSPREPKPCRGPNRYPCYQLLQAGDEPIANDEDEPNVSGVSLFPNPAKGNVNVALPERAEDDTPVRFFDLLGRQVVNQSIPKGKWRISVSLDPLPEGTYVVLIGTVGTQQKLIVTK